MHSSMLIDTTNCDTRIPITSACGIRFTERATDRMATKTKNVLFSDGKQPKSEANEAPSDPPVEIEQPQLNYTFEIIKSCIMAIITLITHIFLGPGTAIATLLSIYFLNQRFADSLNNKIYDRKIGSPRDDPPIPEFDGIPEHLKQLDWLTISKIPGVDAERLKETFETLYKRVHEGTLEVAGDGEWKEIDEQKNVKHQNKKDN